VENNNFINIPIPIEAAQLLVDEAKQGANFAMEEVEGAAKVRQGYHNGVDSVFDFLQGQYGGIYGADIIAEIFLPVLVQGMNPAFLEQFPGLKGVLPTKGQLLDLVRGGAHIAGDIAIPQNRLDVALLGAGYLRAPAWAYKAYQGGKYALQAAPEAVNVVRALAALDLGFGANANKIGKIWNVNNKTGILDAGITWGKGIGAQGYPWEVYLANKLGAGTRLPRNFKTFDFFDDVTRTATSAKTLNTQTASKLANPEKIYHSVKRNIDAAMVFEKYNLDKFRLTSADIANREIRLAIPKQTSPNQWEQLKRAIEYGKERNIKLIITETK
jgi:filamentous hemagglutinin